MRRYFRADPKTPGTHASLLLETGRPNAVLEIYPKNWEACSRAHLQLGNYEAALDCVPPGRKERFAPYRLLGRVDELLTKDHVHPDVRANALRHLGRVESTLPVFRRDQHWYALALSTRGESLEPALKHFPHSRLLRIRNLMQAGKYKEILRQYPHRRGDCAVALNALGRHQEVLETCASQRGQAARALLYLGRCDDVLARYHDRRHEQVLALLYLNRPKEVLAKHRDSFAGTILARYCLALDDIRARKQVLKGVTDTFVGLAEDELMFPHYVMAPFLDFLAERDRTRLEKRYERTIKDRRFVYGQRLWHLTAFITGRIDAAEFRRQPHARQVEHLLPLARAIKAEINGEPAADHYQAYLDLPRHQRGLRPVVDKFAQWRRAELSAR